MNNPVFKQIQEERDRQDQLWGQQDHHPMVYQNILMEEVGEVSNAILEMEGRDSEHIREELIQVAAVAIGFIEALDRDLWKNNIQLPQKRDI